MVGGGRGQGSAAWLIRVTDSRKLPSWLRSWEKIVKDALENGQQSIIVNVDGCQLIYVVDILIKRLNGFVWGSTLHVADRDSATVQYIGYSRYIAR